jgi:hypothetical protein
MGEQRTEGFSRSKHYKLTFDFKVEVGVKGVIQVELENNSTLEIPIKRTKFTAQNRDRFLLAFKTGDELTTGTVKILRAEEQIYLKSNPVKETSKEYQLLFNYYILKDTTSGLKLLGKEGLDSDQIQEADEDQLKKMAMQYRGLIHAMLEQVRGGGRSEKCLKILKEIVDGNAEKIKLAKDRVKDLELLLNKTISSLAESLKNSLKNYPYKLIATSKQSSWRCDSVLLSMTGLNKISDNTQRRPVVAGFH